MTANTEIHSLLQDLCSDCPPVGYPTDKTRCLPCPRRKEPAPAALDTAARVGGDARHTDDIAVDAFAAAMKAKLAKKRSDGRSGWDNPDECTVEFLAELLVGHVRKGDPVDIGNLAMMLFHRNGGAALASIPAPTQRLWKRLLAR